MTNDETVLFTAHRLRFDLIAREPIILGEHGGSAIRGMLYRALMALAGPVHFADSERLEFMPNDPIRFLMATLDETSDRGQDVPRPYTVEPAHWPATRALDERLPSGETVCAPGQHLTFGLTLYARAAELFPYIILAMKRAEDMGIGRGRGRFIVDRVWCENPFTGESQDVYASGDQLVRVPDLSITHADIVRAPKPAGRTLTIEFLTPTTLRANQQSVTTPEFNIVLHRLIERLTELAHAPIPSLPATREDKNALLRQADAVQLIQDGTHWVSLHGHSARRNAPTALSGFAGPAVYEADDFTPFLPLLRWGEITHVGKHAVKGNGLYRIVLLPGG